MRFLVVVCLLLLVVACFEARRGKGRRNRGRGSRRDWSDGSSESYDDSHSSSESRDDSQSSSESYDDSHSSSESYDDSHSSSESHDDSHSSSESHDDSHSSRESHDNSHSSSESHDDSHSSSESHDDSHSSSESHDDSHSSSESYDDSHSSDPDHDWFQHVFGPRRFSFGIGPDKDPWFNLEVSWGFDGSEYEEPWWKGPNVCFSRTEEIDDDKDMITSHVMYHSQVCDGSDSSYKCTTTRHSVDGIIKVTDTYECCDGFTRRPEGFGCEREIVLEDIPALLETLELDEFVKLMDSTGLTQDVFKKGEGNFTLFVPTNEALAEMVSVLADLNLEIPLQDMNSVIMVSEQISEDVVDDTRDILLGHVIIGRYTSPMFSDNQMIETASPYKSKIRINTYNTPLSIVTANCRAITRANNIASNGVIHVMDDVLKPVTETLLGLVSKNPLLSILNSALGTSGIAATLRKEGQLTLFAPTDTAFKKHQALMSRIVSSQKCLDNVLKNHLLPNVICSPIVHGKTKTMNLLEKYSSLTRDADDKLYVDGVQIVTRDVMATNGVLYIIDNVLVPDEALGFLELVEKQGLTEFTDFLKKAGLTKDFKATENVTVFVPSNEAIQALSPEVLADLSKDADKLKRVLQYHVVNDILSSAQFYDNKRLETLVDGARVTINEYSSFPFGKDWVQTVQCAKIQQTCITGCNGVAYVIDRVMMPPVGTVMDVLSMDPRFSTLVQLIKMAGLADRLHDRTSKPGVSTTLFAPTNDAFDSLGSDAVVELKDNPSMLKEILLSHITIDTICCSGIVRTNWFNSQKVRTVSNEIFKVGKNRSGGTYIGDADVIECDVMATNGVVHAIDGVLMTEQFGAVYNDYDWVWDFKK